MKLRTYSFGFWGQSRNRKETIIESLAAINSYCTNVRDLLKTLVGNKLEERNASDKLGRQKSCSNGYHELYLTRTRSKRWLLAELCLSFPYLYCTLRN